MSLPEPSVVRVTRRFTFSAAHRYVRPEWTEAENRARYGALARIHGHTYTLEVTLRGPVDPRTGMAVDLGEVKRLVGEAVLARFDHAYLNDDAAFPPGVVPTTENLVRVIWDVLAGKLGPDRLERLRLAEDPTLWVEYRGEA
ncbi:MAG: 6-pyruvoyl tetrahydrobiopterin synthase [Candidatus Rokuibacteriota bacterium]|jgi:6-pyruvoyltetrahydropterin/6-carboxytetrahydropterin synthase|nr:MAG: 6-pyruvoyl tetrahydrobiopterin synthase [Candidatus Rokubacteria bacterium]